MTEQIKPWTRWLLRLQALLVVVMLAGIMGNKFTLVSFSVAFGSFSLALLSMLLLAIVGLLVLPWACWRAGHLTRGAWMSAVVGAVPVVAILLMIGPKGFQVPEIHDISTDTLNPPAFKAALEERLPSENSLLYPGEEVAALQRQAYPDIQPVLMPQKPAAVFAHSLVVCRDLGWRVLAQEEGVGRIEIVEESLVFGFKDDMVIRITPEGEGSRVDVRSVSRVGVSDLGANAARIRRFLSVLKGDR